jgi:hypothetical protein
MGKPLGTRAVGGCRIVALASQYSLADEITHHPGSHWWWVSAFRTDVGLPTTDILNIVSRPDDQIADERSSKVSSIEMVKENSANWRENLSVPRSQL